MLIFHSDAYPNCEWTEMHAVFAFTGGFRAVGPNSSEQLFDTRFFEYIAQKKIDLPDVSLEEIQDKSKGDYISQTVTVIQTLWFALQAINRTVQGLPVTALELTTLAHVAFNVFICLCWWNKPLNVMVPIDVPLKEGKSQEQKGGEAHQQVDKGSEGQSVPEPQLDGDSRPLLKQFQDNESQKTQVQPSFRVKLAARFPLLNMPLSLSGPRRIFSVILLTCLGTISGIFGAIHCIAWNSKFPSYAESILWRVSATIVTTLPFIFYFVFTSYL